MKNVSAFKEAVNRLLERMEYKERDHVDKWYASFKNEYIGDDYYYKILSKILHTGIASDDFKYLTTYNFLVWLQEGEYECPCDAENEIYEFLDSEVPIYTHGLTEWLNESNCHVEYLEYAVKEHCQEGGFEILSSAYYLACSEISYRVFSAVREVYEEVINEE